MGTERHHASGRPWAVVATLMAGLLVASGIGLLVTGGWPWLAVLHILNGAFFGCLSVTYLRQTVVVTDEALTVGDGLRRRRIAWEDIAGIDLDWEAEAGSPTGRPTSAVSRRGGRRRRGPGRPRGPR